MSWTARRENWNPQHDDARDAGDVDYARVIHSASFRRLQGKTQILNLGDSDFYRTRLTHSLEVAQIAGGIVRHLEKAFPDHPVAENLPERSMMQAIGCTHDLGHPPFGHGGEVALNYCMRDHGGFEGNGHTLRILGRLETFSANAGANLTRRTLLGVMKYPAPYSAVANPSLRPSLQAGPTSFQTIDRRTSKPPKCYLDSEADVAGWVLDQLCADDRAGFTHVQLQPGKHGKTIHKSFDCSVMDVADDIAYGVHDLEDAIALGLIPENRFRAKVDEAASACFLEALKSRYPGESQNNVYELMIQGLFGDAGTRKRFIGRLVFHFIGKTRIEEHARFEAPLLRYRIGMNAPELGFLSALQQVVNDEVIQSPNVQQLEFKGQRMVVSVFEAIHSDPGRLLPRDEFRRFQSSGDHPRVVCDYVAAMTDGYLLKTYDRLFSPRMGSVFDRL